ncbi:VOC family protein [Haloechinothrix sp. LS1_15]|uniref:VOC family protein n=1 Tax=Haloechinothrix sp. LS1_15 TaxID=2652248 RepID=UPI0029458F00|nr:VOC family protein [Haloechinothrix sp. LS1_15]MDV6011353.1 VOC family protein [Haloechinothrix sp. LS1_15]
MTLKLEMVTIDCADPQRLAEFWTHVLDMHVAADYGEFIMLAPNTEGTPHLGLQRVPEPKSVKNRTHLDLLSTDRAGDVRWLVQLGATEVAEESIPDFLDWTVLTDPEGNEFCVGQLQE